MVDLHHVIFIDNEVDFERLALVPSTGDSPVDNVFRSFPSNTLL